MNELRAIVEAADRAAQDGKTALLATVVRVHGSAYRKPGARMLLTEAGWQAGSISGGCLEADILRKAWWRTRGAKPALVVYDSTVAEDDAEIAEELSHGFGLGCNGVVEVLLERIAPGDPACPVAFIERCLRERSTGVIATVIATAGAAGGVEMGQRVLKTSGAGRVMTTVSDSTLVERIALECAATLSSGRSRLASILVAAGGSVDLFLELVQPPLPLLICGAGHDAVPLARIAAELGWAVTVFEPRSGAAARADRFPCADAVIAGAPERLHELVPLDSRTAAIVMSHNTFLDTALLDQLLRSPAQYIGALGPRHRTDRLLAELRDQGKSLPGLERLHAPVGIDIGATDPASIALSILAEIQACVSGRAGGSLRDLAVANRQDRPDNDFAAAANPRTGTCSLITSLPASA